MRAKKYVVAKLPKGEASEKDFEIIEEDLREHLEEGEILCQAEWFSVDPCNRLLLHDNKEGDEFFAVQTARYPLSFRVIKSRCPEFEEGCLVVGSFGWRDWTIYKPEQGGSRFFWTISKVPDLKGLCSSHALGAVGHTGVSAYWGFMKLYEPKAGSTIAISSAGGGTGSIVGQLAKMHGYRTVGLTGSDEKVAWLKEIGFDAAINYKTQDIQKALKETCPDGVDFYFDNVGGLISAYVMRQMNQYGEILHCGSTPYYNECQSLFDPSGVPPLVHMDYATMLWKHLRITSFNVKRWENEYYETREKMRDLILEGKIQAKETVSYGFENIPKAFVDMMSGKNIGKAVVKA